MRTATTLSVLASIGTASAFWRMECRGRVGLARIDPLITPGEASAHVHAIHGSSGFSADATYEDLHNADCTSCGVVQDKSAYWAPVMYFRHEDGQYELVPQIGGMLAYYFLNVDAGNPDSGVKAFPNNFRMIAGNAMRRNFSIGSLSYKDADPEKSIWAKLGQTTQADLAQRAIGFNCLNYHKLAEGALMRHYLPEKDYLDGNCADGVRIELAFPSCWNGKETDVPGHTSHVAYPDLVTNGACPKGFETKLPGLMYETIWATNKFAGVAGQFVLSNGDEQGFGYHGDFISGWDEDFLQNAVNTCTNKSGKISDCPLFTLIDEDTQRECKMKVPSFLAKEKVDGFVGKSLPGNVVVQYGPEPAVANPRPAASQATSHVPVPTVSYQPGVTSLNLPGGVFKEKPTSTTSEEQVKISALAAPAPEPESESETSSTPSPTPAPAPIPSDPPVPEGYELVRTEYHTNGKVVSKVIVIETVQYVTLTTETLTVTATLGAGNARRELNHLHRHRHLHGHGHGAH
ncbi:hypothetical protein QBC35DRAFT_295953 [Podospora australis]|uniref:DUF1996 domain-containing protein n=1 Tax=Podospora australis TaxID=1536484 RepID=A0AAN6X413_9PEZI|nr:hypothetical protein QBC35DRAFT_295953 [Podospora australis]